MANEARRWKVWVAVGLALVFPTAMAWVYFVALPPSGEGPSGLLQTAYTAGKVVMFAYPLVCLWLFERRLPRPELPSARGLAYGLGFGLLVTAGMLLLYFLWLRDLPLFAHAGGRFRRELSEFGLASPWGF